LATHPWQSGLPNGSSVKPLFPKASRGAGVLFKLRGDTCLATVTRYGVKRPKAGIVTAFGGKDDTTMSIAEQVALSANYRSLLVAILLQAVEDERLAQRNGHPHGKRKTWPWPDLTPRQELDRFWRGEWCANICEWLDLDPKRVRAIAQGGCTE